MFVTNLNFQANLVKNQSEHIFPLSLSLSLSIYIYIYNQKANKHISIIFVAILDNLFAYVQLFKTSYFPNKIIFCSFSTNNQKNMIDSFP